MPMLQKSKQNIIPLAKYEFSKHINSRVYNGQYGDMTAVFQQLLQDDTSA